MYTCEYFIICHIHITHTDRLYINNNLCNNFNLNYKLQVNVLKHAGSPI